MEKKNQHACYEISPLAKAALRRPIIFQAI